MCGDGFAVISSPLLSLGGIYVSFFDIGGCRGFFKFVVAGGFYPESHGMPFTCPRFSHLLLFKILRVDA